MAVSINQDIHWVGAIDWNIRNFHGYSTERGTSYNAYLIKDEKTVLIDTVKADLYPQLLKNIRQLIDLEEIDIIISNHVEMDHSGSLPLLLEKIPGVEVISSKKGAEGLRAHYGSELEITTVNDGDSLSTGNRELHFLLTPMVHWPDNMVTLMTPDQILFSNDAFGQHLASTARFNDQLPAAIVMEQARKYYANIVLPYGRQVERVLKRASGLEIKTIAPSHGLIWRKNLGEILEKYQEWATYTPEERALVVYDTMWGSTERIARALMQAFAEMDIPAELMSLNKNHISNIMSSLIRAKYVCLGSPTLNKGYLPSMGALLTYLSGLAPENKIGLAFGSYGWGGQSIKKIHAQLEDCGFEMMDDISCSYVPEEEELEKMTERVKEMIK